MKAIIVGQVELHAYFTEAFPEWDTQVPISTPEEVWSGLENGTLDANSSVVIFTDQDFNTTNSDALTEAIAVFASEAIVIVLMYDPASYDDLAVTVGNKQHELDNVPSAGFHAVAADDNVIENIYNALVYIQNGGTLDPPPVSIQEEIGYRPSNGFGEAPGDVDEGRKRGFVFCSTSSKGGSGKTTVGLLTASTIYHASLAAVKQGLREKPLSVVVVDMDTRDGQIGFVLGQVSPSAVNVALTVPDEEHTLEDIIRENLVTDERLGISALLAPKRARVADYLSPEFYMKTIDTLAYMFDVVVLDTSVNYTDDLLSKVVFPISDRILFVTSLAIGSVYGMSRWMEEVTTPANMGGPEISLDKINVVVNQSAPDLGIDQELLSRASGGAKMLVAIPLDSAAVIAASNHNRLSDILHHHVDISPAYYHIVQQLLPGEIFADPLIVSQETAVAAPTKTNRKKRFGLI